MKISIETTSIEGCYIIKPRIFTDNRGAFVKTFHNEVYKDNNLDTDFKEEYYSISNKGVLRGLHFQKPPHDHVKVVYCVQGSVLDVVVDIRKDSSTFGKYEMFDMSSVNAEMIYIPKGLAHGFYVKSDIAIMMYKVTSIYSPEYDSGIKWDTIGIPWPDLNPIISERDMALAPVSEMNDLDF